MRRERLLFVGLIALTLWALPELALADMAVPVLFRAWPAMLLLLVPVVALEAYVLRRLLDLRWYESITVTLQANLISSLVGVPIVTLLHALTAERFPVLGDSFWPDVQSTDHAALVAGFWIAFALTFVGSVVIEGGILLWVFRRLSRRAVMRAALTVNAMSYALLAAVVIIWPQTAGGPLI